jgi:hypothetical protein
VGAIEGRFERGSIGEIRRAASPQLLSQDRLHDFKDLPNPGLVGFGPHSGHIEHPASGLPHHQIGLDPAEDRLVVLAGDRADIDRKLCEIGHRVEVHAALK